MFNGDILKWNVWLLIWKCQVNFIVGLIFKRAAKLLNKFKHETKHLGKITTLRIFKFCFFKNIMAHWITSPWPIVFVGEPLATAQTSSNTLHEAVSWSHQLEQESSWLKEMEMYGPEWSTSNNKFSGALLCLNTDVPWNSAIANS